MDEIVYCPVCGNEQVECMGALGMLTWFHCKGCGMQFSHDTVQLNEEDDE